MTGRWLCLGLVLTVGCQHLSKVGCPPPEAPCAPEECGTTCPKPCAPRVEVKQQEEIHVNAPRQKVVLPRRGMAGPNVPVGMLGQAVEQQQIVQTRQVMLVPQQVLVPFVQTTATGPIRVNGLSETQVLNVTNTTTGLVNATGQLMAVQGNVAGQAGQGTPAAAAAGASPTTLNDCLVQLRNAAARIEELQNEVKRLQAAQPGPTQPQIAPAPTAAPPAGVPQLPAPLPASPVPPVGAPKIPE